MKKLSDILNEVRLVGSRGDMSVDVLHVASDSRQVKPGGMFVAVRGTRSDGHAFIPQVLEAGAAIIVAETEPDPATDAVWITVRDSAHTLGEIGRAHV